MRISKGHGLSKKETLQVIKQIAIFVTLVFLVVVGITYLQN